MVKKNSILNLDSSIFSQNFNLYGQLCLTVARIFIINKEFKLEINDTTITKH